MFVRNRPRMVVTIRRAYWGRIWGEMARQVNRLTARAVQNLGQPGRHADGGGLYLVVDKSGAKRWVFLFRHNGKTKEMGLGGILSVPLARARELAQAARSAVADGLNPIAERDRERDVPTFGEVADELIESLKHEWRNEKHKAQWSMTLREYAKPLRPMPVDTITTADVIKVLKPIWQTKPETASRVRGRIERVLDAAKARGLRNGENPASWRGHLSLLLPKRQKLSRGHHAAMPYSELPHFVARLRENGAVSALALEFTILTASRTGETLGARWDEIDFDKRIWTVPASRMKGGRPHRVPLIERSVAILQAVATLQTTKTLIAPVFPGTRAGSPLSNMSMQMMLRRLVGNDVTVHGFRSCFRDWVGEETSFQREVAEAALAHVVGDATERAYRRGDALDKRRELMEAWGRFLEAAALDNVVSLQAAKFERGDHN